MHDEVLESPPSLQLCASSSSWPSVIESFLLEMLEAQNILFLPSGLRQHKLHYIPAKHAGGLGRTRLCAWSPWKSHEPRHFAPIYYCICRSTQPHCEKNLGKETLPTIWSLHSKPGEYWVRCVQYGTLHPNRARMILGRLNHTI